MKYKLYRAQYEMQFDENGEPLEWEDAFELVGVEYAQDVDRATPLLIKAITDELGTTPQYANCEVAAYAPALYRQELSEGLRLRDDGDCVSAKRESQYIDSFPG